MLLHLVFHDATVVLSERFQVIRRAIGTALARMSSWVKLPASFKSLFETVPDRFLDETKESWLDCGKEVCHEQGFWSKTN